MHIIKVASIKDIVVLVLIPSPIKYQVKNANKRIPDENPMNLPGQTNPPKYSYKFLVAVTKVKDTNAPVNIEIGTIFFLNQGQTNCPFD